MTAICCYIITSCKHAFLHLVYRRFFVNLTCMHCVTSVSHLVSEELSMNLTIDYFILFSVFYVTVSITKWDIFINFWKSKNSWSLNGNHILIKTSPPFISPSVWPEWQGRSIIKIYLDQFLRNSRIYGKLMKHRNDFDFL